MNKKSVSLTLILSLLLYTLWLGVPAAHAAETLKDGIYSISYSVLKAENDSVSMANDYWEKPAKVVVKNGELTIQMQLNHSQWVTQFKVPSVMNKDQFVDTTLLNNDEAADTRLVQFKVNSLAVPLLSKIHVTVASIEYDHDYTIRFVFDEKSLKSIEAAPVSSDPTQAKDQGTSTDTVEKPRAGEKVNLPEPEAGIQNVVINPKTGDTNAIIWWIGAFIISSIFLISTVTMSLKHQRE